jgi:hypothetical protein
MSQDLVNLLRGWGTDNLNVLRSTESKHALKILEKCLVQSALLNVDSPITADRALYEKGQASIVAIIHTLLKYDFDKPIQEITPDDELRSIFNRD